jgi:hypothetical protein
MRSTKLKKKKVVKKLSSCSKFLKNCQKVVKICQQIIKKLSKSCQIVSKKCRKIVRKVQKAQLAKLPQSVHHRKTRLFVTFFLHKKALKSFLNSLTICDKVSSGKKRIANIYKRIAPKNRSFIK